MSSCQSQTKSVPLKNFEKELNKESINEFEKNSPLINFPSLTGDYKLYNYFKLFGNSGATVVYEISPEIEKILNSKIKAFKRIDNNSLVEQDSTYAFYSKDNNIVFPEIGSEFEELSPIPTPKDSEVEIYLIKSGNLKKAFNDETEDKNQECKFSNGIYLLKSKKKVIYWFLIYNDKNCH
ncbi:MAG: hypothetical protein CFE21_22910 [Bacteroidetes bacterium B1(2017)]|nr:MAG: hypothetical protein CFE21_22910 [Bacteroidetes bacterium B1(2017)]